MVYSIFGKKKTVMENRENISIDRIFPAIVEPVAREFTEKFVSVQERFDATDPDKQAKQGEVTALIGPSFWMKQRRLWM